MNPGARPSAGNARAGVAIVVNRSVPDRTASFEDESSPALPRNSLAGQVDPARIDV